jgi:hypothetical protein
LPSIAIDFCELIMRQSQWTQDEVEWERLKPVIRKHYLDAGKTLKELAQIMQSQYGLRAT